MTPHPRLQSALVGRFAGLLLLVAVVMPACDVAGPDRTPGLTEEITSVVVMMDELDADGAPTGIVFTGRFNDPDGLGGAAPQISTLLLRPNREYDGSTAFFNNQHEDARDLTPWLTENADELRVFYEVIMDEPTDDRFEVEITDMDSRGLPVGLKTTARTVNGRLVTGRILLRLVRYGEGQKSRDERPTFSLVDVEIPFVIFAPEPST